jgi:hypothetical protein
MESQAIQDIALPLNLDQSQHTFGPILSKLRSDARKRAKALPVLAT